MIHFYSDMIVLVACLLMTLHTTTVTEKAENAMQPMQTQSTNAPVSSSIDELIRLLNNLSMQQTPTPEKPITDSFPVLPQGQVQPSQPLSLSEIQARSIRNRAQLHQDQHANASQETVSMQAIHIPRPRRVALEEQTIRYQNATLSPACLVQVAVNEYLRSYNHQQPILIEVAYSLRADFIADYNIIHIVGIDKAEYPMPQSDGEQFEYIRILPNYSLPRDTVIIS